MKLITAPEHEAILSNVAEVHEFKYRASAKSFQILSSGLYSNKFNAIVRELSCNAVDSHVAAGKEDVPFVIHLPSAIEPWFSIRDYGVGLDHDQVINIYTTYFESSKTHSNEFIGGLGLGSKTPFAYTNNFSLTTYKDGIARVYSAFINEYGVPSIALLSEGTSTDETGVEIQFAVESEFMKFVNACTEVFLYFKHKPVFTNNQYFNELPVLNVIELYPGVYQYKLHHKTNTTAVMGNIAYPIDFNALGIDYNDKLRDLQYNLLIHFDIGELDFQASREGLSYIPLTINNILTKLKSIYKFIENMVAEQLQSTPNEWDRLKLVNDSNYKVYNSIILSKTVFKDITSFKFPSLDDYAVTVTRYALQRKDNKISFYKPYFNDYILDTLKATLFVYNDTKYSIVNKLKEYLSNLPSNELPINVIIVDPKNKTVPCDFESCKKDWYYPTYTINGSDLPSVSNNKASKTTNNFIWLVSDSYSNKKLVWKNAPAIDLDDTSKEYIYFPMKGFKINVPSLSKWTAPDIAQCILNSGIPGTKNIQFYGVRVGDMKLIKDKPNWISIYEYLENLFASLKFDDVKYFFTEYFKDNAYIRYNKSLVEKLDSQSPLYKIMTKYKGLDIYSADNLDVYKFKDIITHVCVGINDALINDINSSSEELEFIIKRYPLLQAFASWKINSYAEDIAIYVNAIDAKLLTNP